MAFYVAFWWNCDTPGRRHAELNVFFVHTPA